MTTGERRRLPRILVSTDGSERSHVPLGGDVGLLLHDTSLDMLVRLGDRLTGAVIDLDSVEGLGADEAACDFLVRTLGATAVITRSPSAATSIAARGALALLNIRAVDSTGLARALENHPRLPAIGTVVSPGLVVLHFRLDQLGMLPRPLVAWGFITARDEALKCLARCEAIVVAPEMARGIIGPS